MKKKQYEIESWVFRNLNNYGNCVIANRIIKQIGIQKTEELLSAELGRPCRIRTSYMKGDPRSFHYSTMKPDKEPTYIAEVVKGTNETR